MQAKTNGQAGLAGMPVAMNPSATGVRKTGTVEKQSLGLGCAAGVVAAAIGAALWATISYLSEYQIGWMAIGVGFLVGIAVRQFGKGTDTVFGILGGALALAGCLAGNLLTICLVVSREKAMPLLDVISRLDGGLIVSLMTATFSPIDLLFYGIAIYEAYRFSVVSDPEGEPAAKPA